MGEESIVYHGSQIEVLYPEIRLGDFTKIFHLVFIQLRRKNKQ